MRRLRIATCLIVLGCLAAGACERSAPLDISENLLGVYSILEAGADSASVTLVRYTPDVNRVYLDFEPVAGAHVWLYAGNDTIWLTEEPGNDGFERCVWIRGGSEVSELTGGCYTAGVPDGLRPNMEYSLEVLYPDGHRVTGTTRVPQALVLESPEPGSEVEIGSAAELPIGWTRPAGVSGVVLELQSLRDECTFWFVVPDHGLGRRHPGETTVTLDEQAADSVLGEIGGVECRDDDDEPVAWESIPVQLRAVGYDTTYARYRARVYDQRGIPLDSASIGLDGAVGVFSAATGAERRIVLVPGS